MSDTVKLSARLSRPVVAALADVARMRGASTTEVLRQGISNQKHLQDAHDRGDRLLMADARGRLREIAMDFAAPASLGA